MPELSLDLLQLSRSCIQEVCNRLHHRLGFRLIPFEGIDGLFDFDIDGDVGVDPDFMTLWFSQPSLGLPSKVYMRPSPFQLVKAHVS